MSRTPVRTEFRRFTVTMGQAFHESLPQQLVRGGANIVRIRRDVVEVHVDIWFGKPRTEASVAQMLWDVWPHCAVKVRVR